MSSCLNANLLTVFSLVHYGYFVCITLWVVFSRRRKKNEIIIATYMCPCFFSFNIDFLFKKEFLLQNKYELDHIHKKYIGHNHRCVSICAIWVGFLIFREFYFSFFLFIIYILKNELVSTSVILLASQLAHSQTVETFWLTARVRSAEESRGLKPSHHFHAAGSLFGFKRPARQYQGLDNNNWNNKSFRFLKTN